MKLIIHRGAHKVGGSCVEISCGGSTILVDIGLPLDFDSDESIESCLPQSLFHTLRQGGKLIDGVLLSHPHLDHYGLAGQLPAAIPVYCGKASWDLMNATAHFSPNKVPLPNVEHFEAWQEFQIGKFTITPYLMDHSAFDSYGFLISADGKNISWGRAAVTGQYDSDWFQKRAQFWGYNDVFGGKKKVIGITCGQSQETLHRWAGLAFHA